MKLLIFTLHKKWSIPLGISVVNVTKPQFHADLVTFTEEIINEKLIFFVQLKLRN